MSIDRADKPWIGDRRFTKRRSKSPKPKKGSQSPPLTKPTPQKTTSTKLVSTKGTTEPPGALRAGLVDGGKRRLTRQGADLPQMALVVHSCAHAKLAHTQNCHNEKRKNEGGHRWMPVPARAARRAVGGPCSEPAAGCGLTSDGSGGAQLRTRKTCAHAKLSQ